MNRESGSRDNQGGGQGSKQGGRNS
jgi:hypothetical protein